jgi:trehalose-phosphatase
MIKGIVEVVPRRLNKGLIAKNVLREVEERSGTNNIDFILCMGDDVQDEKMFTVSLISSYIFANHRTLYMFAHPFATL